MEFGSVLLTTLKTAASAVSLVGAAHIVRRLPAMQRTRMHNQLRRTVLAQPRDSATAVPRDEERTLCELLRRPPSSPIVLLGPEGAGTSSIARAALRTSEPSLCLKVNLRELAATGERSLLEQLVHACG